MMLLSEQIQFGDDKRATLPDFCLHCPYLKLCNGECSKKRIVQESGESFPVNYLCKGLEYCFKHTETYM